MLEGLDLFVFVDVGLWRLWLFCVYLQDLHHLEDLFGLGGLFCFIVDVLLWRMIGFMSLLRFAFCWLLFLFFLKLNLFLED